MPISPLSPWELTEKEAKGVESRAPSFMTFKFPSFSDTNNRPSGENCIAVGTFNPETNCRSLNPVGNVEAAAKAGLLSAKGNVRNDERSKPKMAKDKIEVAGALSKAKSLLCIVVAAVLF